MKTYIHYMIFSKYSILPQSRTSTIKTHGGQGGLYYKLLYQYSFF